ncbi:Ig-like domain-containing protein [Krasilnikoviella flava]|uniref:Ig-like domain (Group 3) n=1 Tax=Krasilnikoviella flava TaxID=526729 RepID=A0A1T5ILH4_9MICO|nr:Ig-like domain-containing protein [Krasilnikoviella flava]SKC39858.1 Ig-like domain (group 3) [Krasilnikoviella flava]
MHGARRRAVATVTTWLVALGLVVTGALAPAAAVAEGESSTTVSVPHARWWLGEEVTADVVVLHDGADAEGYLVARVDGHLAGDAVALAGGHGTVTLPVRGIEVGEHLLEVTHRQLGNPEPLSVGSVAFRVDPPARPVIPGSRVYGDPADVRVDLTGTDRPRSGEITLASETGLVLGAAALVDGVADVRVPGTGLAPGRTYRMTHRDAPGGTVVGTWVVDANVTKRPATLTVQTSSTWRVGQTATVTVKATTDLGPATGRVDVRRWMAGGSTGSLGAVTLRDDGTATVKVDPDRLGIGTDRPVFVVLDSAGWTAPTVRRDVSVKPRYQTWIDVDTREYIVPWRYGTARRVYFSVASETGARLDGKVTLAKGARLLGTAQVVDGKGSVLVGSTVLPPGRHSLDADFTPTSTKYDTSWYGTSVRVDKAKPSVRLSMDHTWYRVKADLGSYEAGTVRVSTAGMPERGRLVLETRSPRASISGWRTRWSTDWALTSGDKGVQRVRVPAKYLRTADGRPGKVYLRFRYVPSDPAHVSTALSPAVTITRY